MSFWRQFSRGLGVLARRRAADRDIADEVRHFLEESAAALMAKGVDSSEAHRIARMELGGETAVQEEVRGYGWENGIEIFFSDVHYAIRRLAAKPGFTAVSVLTLALGIGATTAIFSVLEGVMLKPLPYPHPEQLVSLLHTAPGVGIQELNLAVSLYYTYSEENRVFQGLGMWTPDSWTVTGLGEPEEAPGLSVTHGFLAVLGIQPALGRGFTVSDEDTKGERTAILSDSYWKSHFGGEASVLGRRILLDGNEYTVIGVMPPRFQFLDRKISLLAPLRFDRTGVRLISFCCQGVARLRPGVTLTQANADIARMLPLAAGKFPMNPGFGQDTFRSARIAPRLRTLKDVLVGDAGDTLWVLMGTVGIVLIIACANIANLLLVRTDGRRQELAVRSALGAGWGRIARELLLESILLAVAGGGAGLALAYAGLGILVASEMAHLPRLHEISMDGMALGFALGVSIAAGLLFGIIPVFRYARPRLYAGLRSNGRSHTGGREQYRARGILVSAQVAMAMVLLIGSGLMMRTLRALRHVDPGFSGASELETARIGIPGTQVRDPEDVLRMEEAMLRKMEAIPGVSRAAAVSDLPMENQTAEPVYAEDQPQRGEGVPAVRHFKYISPGYIAAIGSRLVAGRDLTWEETHKGVPVALVSENLARELWRDPRAAIGRRIRASLKDEWHEVIGVIEDLHDSGIDHKAPAVAYWPLLQKDSGTGSNVRRSLAYLIRTPRAGTSALLRDMQQAAGSVNESLPLAEVRTLGSVYQGSLARTSLTLILLSIAGGMALLLGMVGIYGVISYSVAQRTREIGIRIALGAPLEGVTGLFVRDGLVISAIGAASGLAAAVALTRLMKSLLFEVSPADPVTYFGASAALIVAATLGTYFPARRAARIDPIQALRAE